MVGVAIGMGCRDRAIPFASTFACFLGRAADQIRMGAVSFANIKYCGSHCGVSIGDDGPSQMALEDLAFFRTLPGGIVLYPTDAVSAERATELAANTRGIVFIRTSRPALPVIYQNNEKFAIGASKVVKHSSSDKFLLVGAGVTLYECLKAQEKLASENIHCAVVDLFCVKPIDGKTLSEQAQRVGGKVVVVEDHYQAGGIGQPNSFSKIHHPLLHRHPTTNLGEAVTSALADLPNVRVHSLHVKELPRSGKPEELLDHYGLSSNHIVEAVKNFH
jgi:transketolase